MNIRIYILTCFLFAFGVNLNAQQIVWTKKSEGIFILNTKKLNQALKDVSKDTKVTTIINFPSPTGELIDFKIKDNAILPKELQQKFPQIHSYKGVAINDPNFSVIFTCAANGINATLLKNNQSWHLDSSLDTPKNQYKIVANKDQIPVDSFFECTSTDHKHTTSTSGLKSYQSSKRQLRSEAAVGDNQLRILRAAIAVSSNYTRFFSIKAGVIRGTDSEKKGAALAGIVASINRINSVFERDLGIRLELIPNNDELIFLESQANPFDSRNSEELSDLANQNINRIVGEDNYDIGHLLTTHFNGGLALIGSLCGNRKGKGFTGFREPEGDIFDITFFAHELGHQLGANHTQNYPCQRFDETAVEAGEGTTIMGYAGGPCRVPSVVIQPSSDAYFHYVSILEVKAFLEFNSSCIPTEAVTNELPSIEPLRELNIPLGTAFALETIVNDRDNDDLTYTWEQIDNERAIAPPESTSEVGPLFRSFPPSASPRRDFPAKLGVSTKWEVLPTVPRTMNFAHTVRDGKPGGVSFSKVKINAIDTGEGFFEVTSQSSSVSYDQNSVQDVTWNVAGTDANDIDVENVKIELSFDGGETYPTVLIEETPNDGSESIRIPEGITTSEARIRVSALKQIFYAVNKSNFNIGDVVLPLIPAARVSSRQRKNDNLLIFRVKTSEPVKDDTNVFYSFETEPSGAVLDFSGKVTFSIDGGDTYTTAIEEFVTIPANNDEVIIALPLVDSNTDSGGADKIKIILNIPEGVSNPNLTSIGTLAKKQLNIKENIIVYPNPSDGNITLEILTIPLDGYEAVLYNLDGKPIFEYSFLTQIESIDLTSLSPGLYILSVFINGEIAVRKIVIQ
ncbi:zinc-dependent metalloprotease [Aquimarina agarivorans]|uniref:zinc-dependent metalloprotease n=1 Tax=Aquimarina agarivorans TaxID=980584 RepID=UPI000248F00B|nr:zinc-dependent metalloprotease [Aquimarina agarivorans]